MEQYQSSLGPGAPPNPRYAVDRSHCRLRAAEIRTIMLAEAVAGPTGRSECSLRALSAMTIAINLHPWPKDRRLLSRACSRSKRFGTREPHGVAERSLYFQPSLERNSVMSGKLEGILPNSLPTPWVWVDAPSLDYRSSPPAHFVYVSQKIGRILEDPIGAGALQLLLAITAG